MITTIEPTALANASTFLSPRAQLALDTILQRPTPGIPHWMLHIMEHAMLERLAGVSPGEYARRPEAVYLAAQRTVGATMIDQWIPCNPLAMGAHGYAADTEKTATTGAAEIVRDGIRIDGPEAVADHLERFTFPELQQRIATFDSTARTREVLANEACIQAQLGPDILKAPYAVASFPILHYGRYGYGPYFMAYALYPELLERHFALQADLALLNNRAVAEAYTVGGLPPFLRLDHDMADSRGMLVNIRSLDRIWLPHFTRCLEPLMRSGVRLIWHCDGNLMDLLPRLLDVGLVGFQGFQYEDRMDYVQICRMKPKHGGDLLIVAGSSVTRTLPWGTPEDVRRELRFLVEHGPKRGLFLGASSSITPGVPWENLETLIAGLEYFQTHGREP